MEHELQGAKGEYSREYSDIGGEVMDSEEVWSETPEVKNKTKKIIASAKTININPPLPAERCSLLDEMVSLSL